MNEADRVRLGHRLADLQHVIDGVLHGQPPLAGEERLEVAALEQLHDDVGLARGELPDVEHLGDVLALQLDRRARLALEPRDRERHAHCGRQHHLDRDALAEVDVARGHDEAHAALTEHALDAVFVREHLAGGEGQRVVFEQRGGHGDSREARGG